MSAAASPQTSAERAYIYVDPRTGLAMEKALSLNFGPSIQQWELSNFWFKNLCKFQLSATRFLGLCRRNSSGEFLLINCSCVLIDVTLSGTPVHVVVSDSSVMFYEGTHPVRVTDSGTLCTCCCFRCLCDVSQMSLHTLYVLMFQTHPLQGVQMD